ncbi:MBL fold metallo-hydrolase [Paenibacillus filicis]|uniref:MBL fold metallo-hydrolase n=1 Tax=Paenibacillus gyeongsangnamensis TaxID=3388067 RepID=A0ABT4Q3C6_9BACL|nr:MBL fold metallo-hydrolase [Paenibacillus filicis]MCZ8511337.1 MBL fold metallo-hydrolase [Paenibacillus filicis]
MSLQIQMIGTGSAFAKRYYNNNALVYAHGFTLLIDCGVTAPRALYELNIPSPQIDAILITHIHADHVGGLEELAFQSQYVHRHRMKLLLPSTLIGPLWDHSLKGGLENKAEGFHSLNDYFEVVPLEPGTPYPLHPDLTLELLPTEHIPGKPSYAILMNEKLYYSSDSRFDAERLKEMSARGVKEIWHDCQLQGKGMVHAALDELMSLPESIQRITRLMHYGDNMTDYIGCTGSMQFIEQHRKYSF